MVFVNRNFFAKLLSVSLLPIALIVSASASASAEEAKEAEDPALKNAVSLYGKASYSEAATEFSKLTGSKQSGDIARYYRALCYQQQKQYKAAKDEYLYLYYHSADKNVKYKSWQALKTLPQAQAASKATTGRKIAKEAPGADAWVMPSDGYGRSGPEATSSVSVTIIPTSCGRRHR